LRRDLADLLVSGSQANSDRLRRRLIRSGIKNALCEICGNTEWNGQPISLELDHVNGKSNDNRLENLRILCPNCHAQTETYRGRNIGNAI
jgi:5-methylcytosine-specific restriction endonuclease McrA